MISFFDDEHFDEIILRNKYQKLKNIYKNCALEFDQNGEIISSDLYQEFYKRSKFVFNDNNDIIILHDLQQLSRNIKSIRLDSINENEPFGNYFSRLITTNNIKSYKMFIDYNKPIVPYSIPCTLEKLVLPFNFNQLLTFSIIENNLKKSFSVFPEHGLVYLDFGIDFNQTIPPNCLPKTLKTLKLSQNYSTPLLLESLPSSLTYLSMGKVYNFSLSPNGFLPKSLKTLIFSDQFNQTIEPCQLPDSLTKLKFGNNFNQPLNQENLPTFLLKISLGNNFKNLFEPTPILRKISFGKNFKISNDQLFPTTLNSLELKNNNFDKLPLNLFKLKLNCSNIILSSFYPIKSLVLLEISDLSLKQIESNFFKLFKNLLHLKFGHNFNTPLNDNHLTNSLKSIEFGNKFNQPLSLTNLINLEYLKIGENFSYINSIKYPISIRSITYNSLNGNKIENGSLPKLLEFFELSSNNYQTISSKWLPKLLKVLIINGENDVNIDQFNLPCLKKLYINRNNKSILINNLIFINQYYDIIETFKSTNNNNLIKKLLYFK